MTELELLDEIEKVQIFMDTYGFIAEDATEKRKPLDFNVTFKFSMPEFWENVVVEDVNALKQQMKQQLKNMLFSTWLYGDSSLTEEDLEECWEICKVMVRMRKGETWTSENAEEYLNKTKKSIYEARVVVENPFEEV